MATLFGWLVEGILTCSEIVKSSLVLNVILDAWGIVTSSFTPSKCRAAAGTAPLPVTAKSYTDSSLSLLLIVIVAFSAPVLVGVNVTVNVLKLLAAIVPGTLPIVNFGLLDTMLLMVNAVLPVF